MTDAFDADLPPPGLTDQGWLAVLWMALRRQPTAAEVQAARLACERERRHRAALREADDSAAVQDRRWALRRRHESISRQQDHPLGDLGLPVPVRYSLVQQQWAANQRPAADDDLLPLVLVGGWALIAAAHHLPAVAAHIAARLHRQARAERLDPPLPVRLTWRESCGLVDALASYAAAKSGRLPPQQAAEALDAAQTAVPAVLLAWVNAAHPDQVAEVVRELEAVRGTRPMRHRLRLLFGDAEPVAETWPELACVESGPSRGLLPLPPPEDEAPEPVAGAAVSFVPR